jgi:hypothetical protein
VTIDAAPDRLTILIDRLTREYAPSAAPVIVRSCVDAAWEAVGYFGATDDGEMLDLAELIAERELRLRLGLEREAARLDPENHVGRQIPRQL